MANPVCEVLLTERALMPPDVGRVTETGAILDFWGVVRAIEGSSEIAGIEYEAHRVMAEHQLRGVTQRAAEKFDLMQIIVHHRIGFVGVGEASLFVRVGSRHRAEGFRASEWVVDGSKKYAPIWKHPRLVSARTPTAQLAAMERPA